MIVSDSPDAFTTSTGGLSALNHHDRSKCLADEVARIITSPYPVPLLRLHEILTLESDGEDGVTVAVSAWAIKHPCQIDPLAECVLESLPLWPYVLDIATRLARCVRFRDALLQQQPSFLPSLTAQAIRCGSTSRYSATAIAVLSHPLPPTIALPTDVQTLFVTCVEQAVASPSAAMIEPLYNLLRGTGVPLNRLLSEEQLSSFEDRLVGILRSGAGSPDQCVSLYCLAIMRVVLDTTNGTTPRIKLTHTSFETNDFLESTQEVMTWRPKVIEQFLTGSKAAKSVQLIVLIVLAAMKNSNGLVEDSSRLRSLRLANEVLSAIPETVRREWCAANAVTIGKLQEKALGSELPDLVKILTLRFLGRLCGVDRLSVPALNALVETFADVEQVVMVRIHAPGMDDHRLFYDSLDDMSIARILRGAVDGVLALKLRQDPDVLDSYNWILQMLLQETSKPGNNFRQIEDLLHDAAFTNELLQLQHVCTDIQTNRDIIPSTLPGIEHAIAACPSHLYSSRLEVIHLLSKLLLHTALNPACPTASSPDTTSSRHLITDILLETYAQSASSLRPTCQHRRPQRLAPMHYVEEHATPHEAVPHDWRTTLKEHLSLRAQSEQAKIEEILARACSDMEARCQNVEGPLHQEQEKTRRLTERNDELTVAFAELESRNVDLSIQNSVLEDERDRASCELEDAQREGETSKKQILELELDLEQVRALADRKLEEMRAERSKAELEHAAVLAKKQELLERANERASSAEKILEQKDTMILEGGKTIAALQSDHDRLRAEGAARSECYDQQLQETEQEIMRVQSLYNDAERSSCSLRSDLEAAETTIRTLQTEQNRAAKQLSSDKHKISVLENELAISHVAYTSQIHDRQQTIASLRQDMETLKTQHVESYARLCAEIDSKQTSIAELQDRVGRLQTKCEHKDAQIADAEAMRSNLIAAMGLSSHALQTSSLPHRSRSSSLHKSQPHAQTPIERSPPTPSPDQSDSRVQGEQETGLSNSSFASSSSTDSPAGPTPKRPRPRRPSTRAPAVAAPTSARPSRKSVSSRRPPLQGITGNEIRRSLQSAVKEAPAKTMHRKSAPAESSFGGSELFADTLGSGEMGDCNHC